MSFFNPRRNGRPGWLGQFELNWPLRLSLYDHRPGQNLIAVSDIANTKTDKIAATQFTVNCEIEHGQIPDLVLALQIDSDSPDVFRLQRLLLTDQLSFVPGLPVLSGFHERLLLLIGA